MVVERLTTGGFETWSLDQNVLVNRNQILPFYDVTWHELALL